MEGEKVENVEGTENTGTDNVVSYDNTGRSNTNMVQAIVYSTDPMSDMANMKDAFIMQSFDNYEQSASCHSKNVYSIYGHDGTNTVKYLFKAKENSNTCTKCFVGADRLPIDIDIKLVTYEDGKEQRTPFIKLERACSACSGGEIKMKFVGEGQDNKLLGTINEPCTCTNPKFEIKDENGEIKFVLVIQCSQTAFCCRQCCCCGGKQLEFQIYGPQGSGDIVAKVVRAGKKGMCHSSVDNYHVDLPDDASAEDKLRLVCAGIICDYLFFEEDSESATRIM
jgi:hypothetical protein